MHAELIVAVIGLILEKGLPAYMKWQDGMALENPTIEDFEKLKVKGMREKLEEEVQTYGE